MATVARKNVNKVTYCKAPQSPKVKKGGATVVSEALVKKGSTNLVPSVHVRRGDMVKLMAGSETQGKGRTGKVLTVLAKEGKIIVEGINVITRASKAKTAMGKGGLIKKEAPIFASRVMLFCTSCKNTTRISHKISDGGKKTRVCKKCNESLDT